MPVELVAEVSSNHGGSIPLAKEFIKRFAEAGADWIKFQSYQVRTLRPDDPQRDWLAKAELSDDAHHELKAACEAEGVKFLTTIFHASRAPFLQSLGLEAIKIGSGEGLEVDGFQVARRVLRSMQLLDVCWPKLLEWTEGQEILSCVTRYPASARACTKAIDRIGYYNVMGYSDHSIGLEMAMWAIESGARIVEKHVCLPNQARAIQPWEASVAEFKGLRAFANAGPESVRGRWQHA